jgi:hypothetical protein
MMVCVGRRALGRHKEYIHAHNGSRTYRDVIVSVVDTQAFAANPDRTYYRGAGSCQGAAYCSYRAKTVKHHKAPSASK